ncbi:hypothetical protein PHAVU_004G082000 [Phaseolus vulgaris]|uniref:Uncharacterized protein n=1 Tax=Phaseolus vulgaris TaxID=3885 RepID=V7C3A7_PHAVU|nr:hypothetical protein PHAVU_004G082000g [Phaseolus vulgaris]ESW23858.1 hypothetical protein PHAVU_004G082000g [Phaseolus vulgaris]
MVGTCAKKAVEHGGLLKLMLRKMSSVMNNPPFNYMIHPSPLLGNGSELAFTHCFILLIPLLIGIDGAMVVREVKVEVPE